MNPRLVKIGEAAYDCRIDRRSKWGNPFVIGIHVSRNEVIARYEEWIRGRPELLARLPELVGKVLACHCAPKRCHGDVLLKLLIEQGLELAPVQEGRSIFPDQSEELDESPP